MWGAVALVAAALVLAGCGGTVREPRSASHGAKHELTARDMTFVAKGRKSPKPKSPKPKPAEPKHAAPGVTFAAVGDTMLGNSPELPADPDTYLDPVRSQRRPTPSSATSRGR